jgi:UDP-glucose:(heptosyl)LPS alpha-1,3-glucosyltransferase
MPLDVALVAMNIVRRDGQGRVMVELTRAVLARGHRVTVYAQRLDDELVGQVEYHPIPPMPGPQIVNDLTLLLRATRALRPARHDVVCALGPTALPRQPFVMNIQFSHQGWRASWTRSTRPDLIHRAHARLAQSLETLCVRRATRIISSTQVLADEMTPAGDPRVFVVPDGIDLDEFRPIDDREREAARAEFGVGDGRFVLAFMGDYTTTRKGLEPLLSALAHGGDEELLLVAARGNDDTLAARVRELGIGDRVAVVGFAPPRTVIAAADVVTVPSLYEPFSLVGLEAAASQRPVIISAAAGVAPLLGDGALIVDRPNDPAALRGAIDRLKHDPALRRTMAAAGRQAAERLTWQATMEQAALVIEGAARSTRTQETVR